MAECARVAVDVAALGADRPLDYLVPEALLGRVGPGQRVVVPLGPRRVEGVVLAVGVRPEVPEGRLRPLLRLVDPRPHLTEELLALAPWLAQRTGSSQMDALRAMIPGGLRRHTADERAREVLWPGPGASDEGTLAPLRRRAPSQARALAVLCERPGLFTAAELARAAGVGPEAVRALLRRGLATSRGEPEGAAPGGDAGAPGGPRAVRLGAAEAAAAAEALPAPPLTRHQAAALSALRAAIAARRHETFVLHGVTGSGKTEVYLRAIETALALGRQALALVPEIALTPQTVARFRARFGDRVAVLHSGQTLAERRRAWRRIADGEVAVAVGARSAVFAPFPRPGLFIVDEEHETSYKQDETPRYHAREVARERARRAGAPLVLGSATPSLEAIVAVRRGEARYLALPERVAGRPLPEVTVVDMRAERQAGHAGLFSRPLAEAVREALARGRQVLFFLNRRGFSPVVLCRDCGQAVSCRACSVALTFHRQTGYLECHYCGRRERPPEACPACGGPRVRYYGVGTEKVEALAREHFPGARVLRMDVDTTRTRGAHERIYEAFRRGEADILVGTQMVAKGWDVAGVTVVGVVHADTGLHLPDFRAAERTFQLLTQVAGRAGRGDEPGRVFVQTYNPDHYAIQAAARQDCQMFWRAELPMREAGGWPPFRELVRVVVSHPAEGEAARGAKELAARLRSSAGLEVLGPAPAPVARVNGRYRWHLAVFGERERALLGVAGALSERPAKEPLRVAVDPDPVSML
ncbi:MAG: primosomal protein N' [Clostridia bacterium]|nr:primosomal protein N' [Clostridia bacterium]